MNIEIKKPVVRVDAATPRMIVKPGGQINRRDGRFPFEGPYEVAPGRSPIILPTDEKYMTDDLTVGAIPPWSWIGDDAELVSTVYAKTTTKLADTSFNGWTPSTTAKTIKSSATAGTFVADMVNYEYWLRWLFEFDAEYQSGATKKNAPYRSAGEIWQGIYRRPNSVDRINSGSFVATACATLITVPLMVYYGGTTNSLTYGYSLSYGIYPAATAATFSDALVDNPTVTIKTPSISARCSATYMSTTVAAKIDQDKSKFSVKGELYRMRPGAALRTLYGNVIDIYRNSF